MRFLAALGVLCFLAGSSVLRAQVQVSAQLERTGFLLYERVILHVTLTNVSDSDVVLNNDEGHPWLSFLVSKHNRLPVHPERDAAFKPVNLKSGESKTLLVNITPLFSFREEGEYTTSAVVNLPAWAKSFPSPFLSLSCGQGSLELNPSRRRNQARLLVDSFFT